MQEELAGKIVHGLIGAGINFMTYLPESRLSQILPLLREAGTVRMVPTASEQEAITIAAGAALGGKRVACYMESTGPYVSAYSILTIGKQMGVPMLLLIGFLGDFADQRNSFLYSTIGARLLPTLDGLAIGYRVLEDGRSLERHIKDAQRTSDAMRAPTALIFTGEFAE
jgi:sulfopyruvate decarboxylase TPP-binding subunit